MKAIGQLYALVSFSFGTYLEAGYMGFWAVMKIKAKKKFCGTGKWRRSVSSLAYLHEVLQDVLAVSHE
jgi:hypothetical protein